MDGSRLGSVGSARPMGNEAWQALCHGRAVPQCLILPIQQCGKAACYYMRHGGSLSYVYTACWEFREPGHLDLGAAGRWVGEGELGSWDLGLAPKIPPLLSFTPSVLHSYSPTPTPPLSHTPNPPPLLSIYPTPHLHTPSPILSATSSPL